MSGAWRPPPSHPFTYRLAGQNYATVDLCALTDAEFVAALSSHAVFATAVLDWPSIPLSFWQMARLHSAWVEHHDLPSPAEAQRLQLVMFRYGKAIEYDLRDVDIAQMWAARRWRRLLNLIDQLPSDSRYVEAQADDDEVAQLLADREDIDITPPPRLSEWGPLRTELAVIADRLSELITLFLAANGGGKVKFAPRPRPVTAMDRVRVRTRRAQHAALVKRVLPQPSEEG